MVGAPVTDPAPAPPRRRKTRTPARTVPRVQAQSLLDLIDTVIDKGLAVDAEVVLGLANIDLIYLRVGALLAAADRVLIDKPKGQTRATNGRGTPHHARPAAAIVTRECDTVAAPAPTSSRTLAPDDTSRSVIRLVLTLVEFVRQLLERQAVRRVREKTLNAAEIERLGTALMQLEATVRELAERHGIDPAELNIDLGPLGTLR